MCLAMTAAVSQADKHVLSFVAVCLVLMVTAGSYFVWTEPSANVVWQDAETGWHQRTWALSTDHSS